jgi:hypothetical protein
MATLSITGAISTAAGQRSISLQISEATADVAEAELVSLASGDNSVDVPPSTLGVFKGCLIVPIGVVSTTTLTFRTLVGDTGVSLAADNPSVFCFNANSQPTTMYIHASTAGGAVEVSYF